MSLFTRFPQNPLLAPDPQHDWESKASFNGSILHSDRYYLYYRAIGEEKSIKTKKLQLSTIGQASSSDGITFTDRRPFITPDLDWERFGCEDPRVTQIGDSLYCFYTALASYPPTPQTIRVALAIQKAGSPNLEKHLITPFNAKAMALFPEKINGQFVVLVTVHTDLPPTQIAIARVNQIETLWSPSFWEDWILHLPDHTLDLKRVNSDQVEVGAVPVKTKYGWVLAYSYIKNYFTDHKDFTVEAVLLDPHDPQKVLARIDESLLIPEAPYELHGMIPNIVFPTGMLMRDKSDEIVLYYGAGDSTCAAASIPLSLFLSDFNTNAPTPIRAKRFANNPLLSPRPGYTWETSGVFNPAAISLQGITYLIYRALGENNTSTFGLAVSQDGYFIDEQLDDPIYVPRLSVEQSASPGSGQGCEDPRATIMGDRLYLCYTAYDGILPRLSLTSITLTDFLQRNFDKWQIPIILSGPGFSDKDGCLFPEKIGDRYVFFHRLGVHIYLDTVDSLTSPTPLLGTPIIGPRSGAWDDLKVGINTVPIKTKSGWLVFYHGIGSVDHYYRLGAFLLDTKDLSHVIARTPFPLLEPEENYEKEGPVSNVVFPCGHTLQGDTIFLYYGGADKYIGGATLSLTATVNHLLESTAPHRLKL